MNKKLIKEIVKATFPEYRGRKISVSTNVPKVINSYWDGGSRNFYKFYQPDTGKVHDVGSNHPFFERNKPNTVTDMPISVVLVKHSIFCGKDVGITIYVQPDKEWIDEKTKN